MIFWSWSLCTSPRDQLSMALPGSPLWPLRLHRLDRLKGLGKQHVFARLASMLTSNLRHLSFLFPKQAQDNITSVRLLRKEVLQNALGNQSMGEAGCCLLWVAGLQVVRLWGAPGETYRRLHFCPGLSLHRSGLSGEPGGGTSRVCEYRPWRRGQGLRLL